MSRKPAASLAVQRERYEGSFADLIGDMRGACRQGMSPADYEGSCWDKAEDLEGQRKLEQKANKSRAWATFR